VLGGRAVLEELTVSFIPGRMTVVVGRSGAGKTTLLELLAGLAHPDAGEVLLDERALGSGGERLAAVRRARIGYLPQEPVPVGFLSATENVALALHARGCARVAATSRLDEETAAAVADLLVAAAQDGGHTVICATHDPQVINRAHAVVTLVA
jgi:ABC-type lipoprotein export system ATPase subunit